jgi:hypothetical protein
MNPYFLEYLQNPEYGYAPLRDPVFILSAALAGIAIFGVPGLLVGLLANDRTVLVALVVGGTGVGLSLLTHAGRISGPMVFAYVADLAFAVWAFTLLTWAGRRWSHHRAAVQQRDEADEARAV